MNRYRNHRQKLFLFIIACWLLIPAWNLSAQEGKAGTQSILHEVGAGARVFGLGRAFVALADDPSAVFWNPAGLEYVPRMSFSLFHTPLIVQGASYDFIGFVYPTLQLGTVGIGYARVGVGETSTTKGISPASTSARFTFLTPKK